MGRFRTSLSYKLIGLLVLSFVVQFAMLMQLARIQSESEAAFNTAAHAKAISESINRLENSMSETSTLLHGRQLDVKAIDNPVFKSEIDNAKKQIETLEKLSSDDPSVAKIVARSHAAFERYLSILKEVRFAAPEVSSPGGHPRSAQIVDSLTSVVSEELVATGKQFRKLALDQIKTQSQLRGEQGLFLGCGMVAIIILTLAFAMFISQRVSRRLELLSINVARLSEGKPLNAVLEIHDEIDELNSFFVAMAAQLESASVRERVIVDDARDLICSIDSRGNFSRVNHASMDLLGYPADQMKNTPFSDYVEARSLTRVLDCLDQVRTHDLKSFDCQMIAADGRLIDALWTAFYSAADESTYCVVHDLTARRELDRIRQNIALMSTHDLRSPLTAIDNYFEMLQIGAFGTLSDEGMKQLSLATSDAKQMMSLIDDFLDLEKIGSGAMVFELEHFDLFKLVQSCIGEFEDIGAERHVSISLKSNKRAVVYADSGIVRKALDRILAYVVERARPSTNVDVTVRGGVEDSEVHVDVRFSSDSLSEEEREAMFERFKIASETAGERSSLLGLYLAKTFVQLCSGRVSNCPNSGQEISIDLCLRAGRIET
jgi:PAS domain S-box-containing protein